MITRTLLILCSALAWAQPAVNFEIRGTVVEEGAGPVANARIRISGIGKAEQSVTTDARGTFSYKAPEPGMFVVIATKDGYFSASAPGLAPTLVPLDTSKPTADVTLALARAGEISGRVLDKETLQPIAGVSMQASMRRWAEGKAFLQRFPAVPTDADGRFRVRGLAPGGDYVVSPRVFELPRVEEEFSQADAETVEESYVASFWPGGDTDVARALPVRITSGSYVDVGTVYVEKAKLYRAQVRVGACGEDGVVSLAILRRDGGATDLTTAVPCGAPFLLKGLDPGSHAIYAMPAQPGGRGIPETLMWGHARFEVIDKNLDIDLPLQPGTVLEGVVTLPEGTKSVMQPDIRTHALDLMEGAQPPREAYVAWAEDQLHFRMAIAPLSQRIQVNAFGGGPYVKEVRYGGSPLKDGVFPVGAPPQRIEIVMDDKFASVSVSVLDGSRPAPNAVVFLVADTPEQLLPQGATGGDGVFRASRVSPGTYRILAIPRGQDARLQEPGVRDRLLMASPRVVVAPSGAHSVEVRLSDLR